MEFDMYRVVCAAVSCTLALSLTLPSVLRFSAVLFAKRTSRRRIYEDDDGKASDQSISDFSVIVQRWALSGLVIIGLKASLVTVWFSTQLGKVDQWDLVVSLLQFFTWILLSIQSFDVVSERYPTRAFRAAARTAVTCASAAFATGLTQLSILRDTDRPEFGPVIVCLISATSAFFVCISFPRRPDIFFDGKPVDLQRTVSLYQRLTFAWPSHLLKLAASPHGLWQDDLPALDCMTRSGQLVQTFVYNNRSGRLLKTLLTHFRTALISLYSFTILNSAVVIVPPLMVFNLLSTLEQQHELEHSSLFWVFGLGLALLLQALLNSWMQWTSISKLKIPVHIQLSAMVSQKAMQIIQQYPPESAGPAASMSTAPTHENTSKKPKEGDAKSFANTSSGQSPGVINLIGVDVKRISDFAGSNHLFAGCILKLLVSFGYLIQLLGWQSVLAGVAAQLIIMPTSIITSRKYANVQCRLMSARDEKMETLGEFLRGISQIKFSALETNWEHRINKLRDTELLAQRSLFSLTTILIGSWLTGPVLLSAISLGMHALIYRTLAPSTAFTAVSVLASVENTFVMLPHILAASVDAMMSLSRVSDYLATPKRAKSTSDGNRISFNHASLTWPRTTSTGDRGFVLSNLNFIFPKYKFSIISGPTGSGKSLILAAILGDAEVLSGSISVPEPSTMFQAPLPAPGNPSNWILPNHKAFVAQEPWIENKSIQDNILFGLPFMHERYETTLASCALDKDVAMLEDGDQTELGHSGVNLSGGQKWRITLARALYSRASILVLDDIFSAVDVPVGRHILNHALLGPLGKGRTTILVTHHVDLCREAADFHVRIANGMATYSGPMKSNSYNKDERVGGRERHIKQQTLTPTLAARDVLISSSYESSIRSMHGSPMHGDSYLSSLMRSELEIRSLDDDIEIDNFDDSLPVSQSSSVTATESKPKPRTFVEKEVKVVGRVKWNTYKRYFAAAGQPWQWIILLLVFISYQVLLLSRAWWVARWTSVKSKTSTPLVFHVQNPESIAAFHSPNFFALAANNNGPRYFVLIYFLLSFGTCAAGMLGAISRAPKRWLDIVPSGRIRNRFASDFFLLDSELCSNLAYLIHATLGVLGITFSGIVVSPVLALLTSALFAPCVWYATYYLAAARDMRRLESIARSKIFDNLSSSMLGASTIRAFRQTDSYVENLYSAIDGHGQALWYTWCFNQWFSWRLGLIGSISCVTTAAFTVLLKIDAGLAGFVLSFTLQYSEAVVQLLKRYSEFELDLNAMERINEYSEMEIEDQEGFTVPASWPSRGCIEIRDLVAAYSPSLPPTLKGITCTIQENERVGIVGRTGAGKSSLMLAIFRFMEFRCGTIHVDGIDISKIRLQDLRQRLAIIPQDPVLFQGTIRSNLDPWDEYSDEELLSALRKVHLIDSPDHLIDLDSDGSGTTAVGEPDVRTKTPQLYLGSLVAKSASNLSSGQRQRLCLARAIVMRPKIVILDEATSAVDGATDKLIQRSIREEFASSTILVIAHRLSTIIDFDKILVVDEGRCAEFGSPQSLLARPDGLFRKSFEAAGVVERSPP